jgi:hypothetical protein
MINGYGYDFHIPEYGPEYWYCFLTLAGMIDGPPFIRIVSRIDVNAYNVRLEWPGASLAARIFPKEDGTSLNVARD